MRIEQSKPNITEYSFLRLLVSTLRSDYHEVIVAKHQLEKDLYTFYDDEDFNFLFEDVLKKESIEGNNYVDISASFQMAYAWGLLSMVKDAAKDVRSVINLSEEEAIDNLNDYNEKQVNAMQELVNRIKGKENTRDNMVKDDIEVVLVPVFKTEEQEKKFAKIARENMSRRTLLDSYEREEDNREYEVVMASVFQSEEQEAEFARIAREEMANLSEALKNKSESIVPEGEPFFTSDFEVVEEDGKKLVRRKKIKDI